MIDPKVEKEIEELLKKLQGWEDIDPLYLGKSLKELRHKIIQVHARLEISVDIVIGDYILTAFNPKLPDPQLNFRHKLNDILSTMDFAKKVAILKDVGRIQPDTVSKLYKVNDLRKYFAHPLTYYNKTREYKDSVKYLEALKSLVEAYEEFEQLFVIKAALRQLQEESKDKTSDKTK
jgi:hypothetical protein